VTNSGEALCFPYMTIRFPRGVYVEELNQRAPRDRLERETPESVWTLVTTKDLVREYTEFVDACLATEYVLARWDPGKLGPIVADKRAGFLAKGADLHVSYKIHGRSTFHPSDKVRVWLEYVDLDLAPNYVPQRAVGFGARTGDNGFGVSVFGGSQLPTAGRRRR